MVSKELQAKFDKRRAAADVAGGERDDEADNARVLAYLKTKRVSVLQHMSDALLQLLIWYYYFIRTQKGK